MPRPRPGELQTEANKAGRGNDAGRAAKTSTQRDFLVGWPGWRAAGLGGHDRRAAAHAERARLNVTRTAMANLARANPVPGSASSVPRSAPAGAAPTPPGPRAPITSEHRLALTGGDSHPNGQLANWWPSRMTFGQDH